MTERRLEAVPNVTELNMLTRLPLPVKRVLKKVAAAELEDVVIVGYRQNGEFYFASSLGDGPEVLWRLEMAKRRLLEIGS